MSGIEKRLTAIGFRGEQRAPECWRIERTGPARRRPVISRAEPACSLILPLWLDRLGDRKRPSVYRIRRIAAAD
jgi:hypothetical protein